MAHPCRRHDCRKQGEGGWSPEDEGPEEAAAEVAEETEEDKEPEIEEAEELEEPEASHQSGPDTSK